jgi:hypothetical protein
LKKRVLQTFPPKKKGCRQIANAQSFAQKFNKKINFCSVKRFSICKWSIYRQFGHICSFMADIYELYDMGLKMIGKI